MNNGWIVGPAGTIHRTADGSGMWTRHASGTREDLKAVHFVDSTHGWAVGEAAQL